MRNAALARLSGIAGKMEGGKIGCGIADFRHATLPSSPQSTQSGILVCIRFYFLPPTADCRLSFPACDSFILPLLFAVCTFLPLSAHFCLLWLISVSYFARWPYA